MQERDRPFVTVKLAATLDGRIATAKGESRWISSPAAREFVHRLRATQDAILVGSGTILADDPELSARRGGRVVHRPVRVVVDSRLRTPLAAKVVRGAKLSPTWILCASGAAAARRRRLEASGVRVIPIRRRGTRLDLGRACVTLAREGLTTVLCEGGGRLAAGLLRAELADELHWIVAPKLLGAEARPGLGELGIRRLSDAVVLEDTALRRLGPDLHIRARLGRIEQ